MKEALFNFSFFLFFCISNLSFALGDDYYSYDFVHIDVIPSEIAKNSIALKSFEVNEKLNTFISTNHWFSENLYFSGSISPSTDKNINITYSVNFGYKSEFNINSFRSIYFDLGYYAKRFDSDFNNKWKSISILSEFNIKKYTLLYSYSYIFNNISKDERDSNRFLSLSIIKNINKNFFINLGINIYNEEDRYSQPFLKLGYKI